MQIPTLVVERNARIGDIWRHRYPTLALHTPKSQNNRKSLPILSRCALIDLVLPFLVLYAPFPDNWPVWTPRDQIADWLEQYATSQDLVVWTTSSVVPSSPSYDRDRKRWTVDIDKAGEFVTIYPAHIVVATGSLGEPHMPVVEAHELFEGQILHSAQFQGGAEYSGKRVVVVGTGNSAADIALDLSLRGAESVMMVQRSSTVVQPAATVAELQCRAYPLDVPVEISDFKAIATPIRRVFEILCEQRKNLWESERGLIEGLRNAGMQVDMGPGGGGILPLVFLRFGGFWMDLGTGDRIISGKIQIKSGTSVQQFTKNSVVFNDGSSAEADVVIFATGYQTMELSLKTIFGEDLVHEAGPLPYGIDEEGELQAGYRLTGHPGLWYAPGGFNNSRIMSRYLGIQIQALDLGYM